MCSTRPSQGQARGSVDLTGALRIFSGAARNPPYVPDMKPDHDDMQAINLAIGISSLFVGLISLMVSLHLGSYVIVALLGAGIGSGLTAALILRRRR